MKRRQKAAIHKSKEQRLLQSIQRFDRYGMPTQQLSSWYSIIPIPEPDNMVPVSYRLWVQGRPKEVYDSVESAIKGVKDRVKHDDMKVVQHRSLHDSSY